MLKQTKISLSPDDTFEYGKLIGSMIQSNTCVLISGTLGAGKTQLIKGVCNFFGINETEVQSPTYNLHHQYKSNPPLHHFDLYRLKSTEEFFNRGFSDILELDEPILIEWPSMVDPAIFQNKHIFQVFIEITGDLERSIKVSHG